METWYFKSWHEVCRHNIHENDKTNIALKTHLFDNGLWKQKVIRLWTIYIQICTRKMIKNKRMKKFCWSLSRLGSIKNCWPKTSPPIDMIIKLWVNECRFTNLFSTTFTSSSQNNTGNKWKSFQICLTF